MAIMAEPKRSSLPSDCAEMEGEKYFIMPRPAIMRLRPATIKLITREAINAVWSARLIRWATQKPLIPSIVIMPKVKTRPRMTEKTQPARLEAAKENKAAWLMVSKDKANRAPIEAISSGWLVSVSFASQRLFNPMVLTI